MKKSPGAVDPHPGLFLPEHLGGLKKGQQPHPQLLLLPHPQPLLFHPPQQNRRIRTSQQSELQPLLLFPHPHPPQQERRSRIQIILQPLFPNRLLLETPHPLSQPQPLSHPHPQFVALMSLISGLQINLLTLHHMAENEKCYKKDLFSGSCDGQKDLIKIQSAVSPFPAGVGQFRFPVCSADQKTFQFRSGVIPGWNLAHAPFH